MSRFTRISILGAFVGSFAVASAGCMADLSAPGDAEELVSPETQDVATSDKALSPWAVHAQCKAGYSYLVDRVITALGAEDRCCKPIPGTTGCVMPLRPVSCPPSRPHLVIRTPGHDACDI